MASLTYKVCSASFVLLLAACGSSPGPEVRPVLSTEAARTSAFDEAYEGGKRHLAAGRASLALVLFDRALRLAPQSVAALNGVAAAFDNLRQPHKAAPFYVRALDLAPNNAETLNNMGISALIAGRPNQAREYFQRALAARPSDPAIRANALLAEEHPPPPPERREKPSRPGVHFELVGLARSRLVLGESFHGSRY